MMTPETIFLDDFDRLTDKHSASTRSAQTVVSPGGAFQRDPETFFDARTQRKLLIARDPGICNNDPIIRGTRISVANIVELRHLQGWDVQRIQEAYPHLRYQQIIAALEYYEEHALEVDRCLQEEQEIDEG
jgi:uncharacterized protein (DUF433 family)